MSNSYTALIKPELLVWARRCTRMEIEEAADRIGVSKDTLQSWENGTERPTVVKLRKVASVYRQSFATFYLPTPPPVFDIPVHDFRRFPGDLLAFMSPDLVQEISLAVDRRMVCLDLYAEIGDAPPEFALDASPDESPHRLADMLREFIGIPLTQQQSWRNPRIAFNKWREAIEEKGALVFQATNVALSEMRGFSLAAYPLPTVVVNRKDAYAGRTFTMMHELLHIVFRTSGLCDLDPDVERDESDTRMEIYCNRVAGEILVPASNLLGQEIVRSRRGSEWEDYDIERLAMTYSVSREVILRRLLIMGLTTQTYYLRKRREYGEEFIQKQQRHRKKGFLLPATDIVSSAGRPFSQLVLEAFHSGRITANDASDFFGVRTKHFDQIGLEVGMA